MTGDTLLVFVKRPVAGMVKTRLAATVGADEAARLYGEWIGRILAAMAPLRPRLGVIGYYTGGTRADFARWDHLVDNWWPQPEGDLGARLDHAFRLGRQRVANDSSPRKVLAIGSDCLELGPALVRQALLELEANDMVIGPTHDGGYYLIGARRWDERMFEGIRWSTDQTLRDQCSRCVELGWSLARLPPLADIDTAEDWNEYRKREAERQGAPP